MKPQQLETFEIIHQPPVSIKDPGTVMINVGEDPTFNFTVSKPETPGERWTKYRPKDAAPINIPSPFLIKFVHNRRAGVKHSARLLLTMDNSQVIGEHWEFAEAGVDYLDDMLNCTVVTQLSEDRLILEIMIYNVKPFVGVTNAIDYKMIHFNLLVKKQNNSNTYKTVDPSVGVGMPTPP